MDEDARGCYRLACRAAAQDVYEAAHTLVWNGQGGKQPGRLATLLGHRMAPAMACAAKCSQVKSMVCAGATFGSLAGLPHAALATLNLSRCAHIADFSPLGRCSALTDLNLHAVVAKAPRQHESLAAALLQLTSMRRLGLGYIMCAPPFFAAVPAALRGMRQLQSLCLQGSVTPDHAGATAAALAELTRLTSLNIAYIGHATARTLLSQAVGKLPRLEELDSSFNHLGQEGARVLAAAVAAGCTALRTLNLSFNALGDAGMQPLGAALAALPHIQTLILTQVGSHLLVRLQHHAMLAPLGGLPGNISHPHADGCDCGPAWVGAPQASRLWEGSLAA